MANLTTNYGNDCINDIKYPVRFCAYWHHVWQKRSFDRVELSVGKHARYGPLLPDTTIVMQGRLDPALWFNRHALSPFTRLPTSTV